MCEHDELMKEISQMRDLLLQIKHDVKLLEKRVKCPACGGEGEVGGYTCKWCEGKGF